VLKVPNILSLNMNTTIQLLLPLAEAGSSCRFIGDRLLPCGRSRLNQRHHSGDLQAAKQKI
jgi:hypothetical protein